MFQKTKRVIFAHARAERITQVQTLFKLKNDIKTKIKPTLAT